MTDTSRPLFPVDCSLSTGSPSPVPKPSISKLLTRVSICSLVTDDPF